MANLSTKYMGLELKNPVIISSCGITETATGVQKCEAAGVGAVVMKSVFEEQINAEISQAAAESLHGHTEWQDYLTTYVREESLKTYLSEMEKAKSSVSIPVFGSVNCATQGGWIDFVKRLEATGVDGLELNMFVVPNDFHQTSEEIEMTYVEIYKAVASLISIPVVLKLPPYITTPNRFIRRLSDEGAKGFVLFNRSVPFDIDIDKQKIAVKNVMSAPQEISYSLRMVSWLAGQYECQLAASTGIHNTAAVIKQLLAGADVVQLCSTIYKNEFKIITHIVDELNRWLDTKGFESVDDIRGKLSLKNNTDQALYERVQYIKAFTGIK